MTDDEPPKSADSSTKQWIAVGIVVPIVVALIAIVPSIIGSADPTPPPVPTSVVPTTVTPTSTSVQPADGWLDEFSDGAIDDRRWLLEAASNVIYERDGALHLAVPSERPDISFNGDNPRITALPAGRDIREFSFELTFVSAENHISGGAGGAVFDEGNREYSAYVGPGGDAIHTIALTMCTPTDSGENCISDSGPRSDFARPLPVRIVWAEGRIDMYVDSETPVRSWPAPEPPSTATFSMYAGEGSIFHVMIDNVRIEYL